MGHPQVFSRSVGESIHLISIGSTRRSCLHPQIRIEARVGRRMDRPRISPSTSYYMSPENSIQANNNLRKKMVE